MSVSVTAQSISVSPKALPKFGLEPFKIAHVFFSPKDTYATTGAIENVVKQLGHNKMQYRHIAADDAKVMMRIAELELYEVKTEIAKVRAKNRSAREAAKPRIQTPDNEAEQKSDADKADNE